MIPTYEQVAQAIKDAIPHVSRDLQPGKRHAQDHLDAKEWYEKHKDVIAWCNLLRDSYGGWTATEAGKQLQG